MKGASNSRIISENLLYSTPWFAFPWSYILCPITSITGKMAHKRCSDESQARHAFWRVNSVIPNSKDLDCCDTWAICQMKSFCNARRTDNRSPTIQSICSSLLHFLNKSAESNNLSWILAVESQARSLANPNHHLPTQNWQNFLSKIRAYHLWQIHILR